MKKFYLLFSIILPFCLIAQNVGITDDGNSFTPNSTSVLELKSTSKGLLIPRMTYAQRIAISAPAEGLMVYQTDEGLKGNGFYYNSSSTATPAWVYVANSSENQRENYKLIKSLSDFPTPVNGVITLQDNYSYEINGAVNIGSNQIQLGESNILFGIDKSDDKLIYTGSGNMISGNNEDFTVRTLLLYAPTPGSKVFNITGSTNKVQIVDNIFYGCKDLGVFNGGNLLAVDRNLLTSCADGFLFKGTLDHLFYIENVAESNSGEIIEIPSGTFNSIMIQGNYFRIEANKKGLEIAASNLTVDDAKIVDNFFHGAGDYVSGVTTNYASWFFYGNTDLEDTDPTGMVVFDSNTVTTTIAAKNTYYKVAGNNFSSNLTQFDTNGVNNRLRYTGTGRITADISVTGSILPDEDNKHIWLAVVLNGTWIVAWKKIKPSSTVDVTNFTITGTTVLRQNEYLEVWVKTQGKAFDVRMVDMQFKVDK